MRNTIKAAFMGLALMSAASTAAMAASSETVTIHNNTNGAVWVTIYGASRGLDKLDWGCAKAHNTYVSKLSLQDMVSSWGGLYVRYEYKQNADCTGKTNHDTHYGSIIAASTSGKMDEYVPAR